MELFGIRLVGLNEAVALKFGLTLGLIVLASLAAYLLRALLRTLPETDHARRIAFWGRQGINLLVAAVVVLGIVSIWFDEPRRLTTALGLLSAGLAFALQKVVTSLAGYFLILRGRNFTVGDRITMGGVRGDVIALGFFQTTILEMGQPPAVQGADPAMWVRSREFTGRIVTVANSRIFDDAVYNYTREFPFIWEEISLPIAYRDDRARAEALLLEAGRRHSVDPRTLEPELVDCLQQRYGVELGDFEPRVYWRLTDNWLEMTLRLLTRDHGARVVKDAMTREVLAGLEAAGIGIASSSMEIAGVARVRLEGGRVRN